MFYAGYVEYLPWEVSKKKRVGKTTHYVGSFDLNQETTKVQKQGKRVRLENNPDFVYCVCV